jgi:hypothetical protein
VSNRSCQGDCEDVTNIDEANNCWKIVALNAIRVDVRCSFFGRERSF